MKNEISRRDALKLFAAGIAATSVACSTKTTNMISKPVLHNTIKDSWSNTHDRVWLGGEYWANPMEDWRINNGAAECITTGGQRSVHSLQHQLVDTTKAFRTSVRVKLAEQGIKDGGASIRFGIRSEINEYRSNCFVQQGLDIGIIANQIALGDKRKPLSRPNVNEELEIIISGAPQAQLVALNVEIKSVSSGESLGRMASLVASEELLGNLAVVSNFEIPSFESGPQQSSSDGGRYQFKNWQIEGAAFSNKVEQKFGPILWTMYTLNNSRSDEGYVMNLSVLTGPLGEKDSKQVILQTFQDGGWQVISKAELDTDAWVASFRIANWDEKKSTRYRVVYGEGQVDGSTKLDVYEGMIRANPSGRKMRMASLTCQNDYAFPYEPVANNVVKMDPDLVLFSGDQLYENHGGFGMIRVPAKMAILNYLRKYYQFGWAFRDAMRNAPTICLPDDHDVLQGNLWGEGGSPMPFSAHEENRVDKTGGYIEPIRMLNVVHRTHTAHHMKPIDPTPSKNGLSVYYGELIYGDVSFAIVADRQWKSGPERLDIKVGTSGNEEEPNYINPKWDAPDLHLLGERQEQFLKEWSHDWREHKLKALISQTIFASLATHQMTPKHYLKYDFDANGWPASGRNRAVEAIKGSKALHICGDTHLPSLSQYGLEKHRDSNWAFCTPAIAVGWQRWWRPDDVGLKYTHRPEHGMANTGEYLDSFGNKNYIYAIGNPEVSRSKNRYVMAHEKSSGFGFVTFDKEEKTYTMEAYKFMVDITDGKASNQFDGWPLTIKQSENQSV
ncbi:alkaline phosphatase D family protein [Psychrosphaera sp. F3M07]|uniref:alkaline phosphatase D family protein n=1 Tax=Psychrosphaera sp. F3M07 TaxID=2841560 RepID=UPI001C0946DE|nr:alkaline phosphatase D family protein [Psychrosphaera sp. F3M07]MBU2918827.1 alkaline phosphatase D family protein [Psychrosphaera sp. F3M07]